MHGHIYKSNKPTKNYSQNVVLLQSFIGTLQKFTYETGHFYKRLHFHILPLIIALYSDK